MRPVALALCCLTLGSLAFAQSDRGTITGTISDPAGAVVPSAPVQARNVATGIVYPTAATATGNYTIPQLPAGQYEVSVAVTGFKKLNRSGLTVDVAQTLRLDLTLEVGSSAESITVTGEASLLKTESGELSHTVGLEKLDELPLFGIGGTAAGTQGIRNPNAITLVIPGVYWAPNADLRVNGVPSNTQSYRIEGQEAMNTGTPGTPGQNQPSVDAIQEVAVQTSNFAAEYGQAGGGVFNLTMRSGTNQFHGSGYEYYVNEFLNAGNPFTDNGHGGNIRPRQRRNDFGFTVGGPVWVPKVYNGHDKTFFFFGWEEFKETTVTSNSLQTVPTQAYRNGNFATAQTSRVIGTDPLGGSMFEGEIFDPNTTQTVGGKVVRSPFLNNAIPTNRFDSVAVKVQNLIPLPQGTNATGLVNNYINPYASHRISPIPSLKLDESLGNKAKVSFFWQRTHTENPDGNATLGQSDGLPGVITTSLGTFTNAPLYRLNFDYSITPTLLLHLGGGYRSTNFNTPSVTQDGKTVYTDVQFDAQKELGLVGGQVHRFFTPMSGLLAANGTGGMKNMGSAAYGPTITESPTFNASTTWVRGNHTFKFGSEFRTEAYIVKGYGNDGTYAFSAQQTGEPFQNTAVAGANVGFPYASFLLGQVNSVGINGPISPRTGKSQLGLYAQDTWKITRRLTLDYGLRYDYSTYLKEQYGRAPDFNTSAIHPRAGIPGAGIYEGSGTNRCNCNFAHNYPYGFGPRLGVAYQINSKTVVRGGFAIVYGSTEQNNNATGGLASSSGGSASSSFGFPVTTFATGILPSFLPPQWPTYNMGFYPTGFPTPGTGPVMMDPNAGRPPRQYQWSVSLQREIFKNLVVEAAYVGNRGIWWQAPGLQDFNALSYDRLKAYGLDPVNNAADRTLLNTLLVNLTPAQKARGFGGAPYPGFPLTQTVAQSLRPFPQFTTIPIAWDPLGKTWYDSLQIKATKRLSHGFSAVGTYTWEKNLAMGGEREPNFGTAASGSVNDVFNRQNSKYISQYDQPQSLLLSLNYVTPKTAGNKWLSMAARDWTVGAVLDYRSGLPILAPGAQSTPSLASLVFQSTFANRVSGQPLFTQDINCHCYDPQKTFILNPAAWADPPAGSFGTSAAYYEDYRYQRRPQENFNFGRTFKFTERVSLNIRAEFTNVFNRAFIANPSSGTATGSGSNQVRQANGNTASGFGAMLTTSTLPPRNGVLIGRITF